MAGRPTKLTEETQKRIYDAVVAGLSIKKAAEFAGIGEGTLRGWMVRGTHDGASDTPYREFRQTIYQARATRQACPSEPESDSTITVRGSTELPMEDPTTLYRFFDAGGCLLYAGVTGVGMKRFGAHGYAQPWWGSVVTATLQHFETRAEALAAETLAIQNEEPKFNVAGKRTRPPRVLARKEYTALQMALARRRIKPVVIDGLKKGLARAMHQLEGEIEAKRIARMQMEEIG